MGPFRSGLLLALSLASTGSPPAIAGQAAPDLVRIALETEAAWLTRRVELAASEAFHLIVEPTEAEIGLALGGVTLLRLPIVELDVLEPRARRARLGASDDWRQRIWEHGMLAPAWEATSSTTLGAPPSDETADGEPLGAAVAEAPPPIDALVPVPDRYWVRFEGGLALEVVSHERASATWTVRARHYVEDAWTSLTDPAPDRLRLRLELAADDAARLYRSLPPDVSLVVAPDRAGA